MATNEDASSPKIRLDIHLPASLVRRVGHAAIDEQANLLVFAEKALEQYLEDH